MSPTIIYDLEKLKSVLADLEKASGADRDLDIRIATTVDGWTLERRGKDKKTWLYRDHDRFGYERKDPTRGWNEYPRLTHSLDATIALVERVLPGWTRSVSFWHKLARASLWECDREGWHGSKSIKETATSKTEPLALLTAMFRALVAKMEASHAD